MEEGVYPGIQWAVEGVYTPRQIPPGQTLPRQQTLSQGLLGLCCSIETRDHVEIITITAVLFD